jgi:hypothetical protein
VLRRVVHGIANALLALVACALTVLAFEGAARVFLPEWAPPAGDRDFWAYDALLGWRHRPNQSGMHVHRDFAVRVSINRKGLRDSEYPYERVPGKRRMLLLGDSFAWGYGVPQDRSLGELVEARRPDWEIINAGVSGYGTDQQLLWLQHEGHRYRPDVILLLLHPNDFLDNHSYSRYGYRKPLFVVEGERLALTHVPVERRDDEARLERWLHLNSYVYPRLLELPDLAEETVEGWLAPAVEPLPLGPDREPPVRGAEASGIGPEAAAEAPPETPKRPRKPRHLTRESEHMRVSHFLLRDLAVQAERLGAQLVVASVPMVPHLREHLAEILDEIAVPHGPLDRVFAEPDWRKYYFPHDPHWNEWGHRVAADALEDFLEASGVLARRDGPAPGVDG